MLPAIESMFSSLTGMKQLDRFRLERSRVLKLTPVTYQDHERA